MGGGPAGRVRLPGETERFVDALIFDGGTIAAGNFGTADGEHAIDTIGAMHLANPYEGVAAYSPDQDLRTTQARLDTFFNLVDSVDEQNDWTSFLETALSHIDDIVISDSQVDTEVADFTTKTLSDLARSYNRIMGGFADIGAVNSTAFPMGMSLIEEQYNSNLSRFRTERTTQARREKAGATLQAVDQIIRMFNTKAQGSIASAQVQQSVSTIRIAAKTDQLRVDTGLNVDEESWDLDALTKGAKLAGVTAGVNPLERGPTQFQSVLSGLATGVGAGLQLGAVTGNVGIGLIGALVGGGIGAFSGQDAFNNV